MARARTWKLQLNLDDFNSAWASLANSPEERASFIEGMWRGMNAGRIGPAEDFAFQEGHAFGLAMREEAEEYRKQSAEAGTQGGYRKHKDQVSRDPSRDPSRESEATLVGSVKPILNPQSLILKPDPTNPTSPPAQRVEATAKAAKGGKVKVNPITQDEDLSSFQDLFWKAYPKRVHRETGRAMPKGNFQETFRRAKALLASEGRDWAWLNQLVKMYPNHPSAQNGFVQLSEVFLGEKGHWLECATRVQRNGVLRPALDRSGGGSLPALFAALGDSGTEEGAVLEASSTAGGGPPRSDLDLPGV